jgi:hypothetical protein
MYRCQVTGRMSKLGEKLNKIVVATRQVEYKNWDREAEEEWFSYGTEIVREINATDSGVKVWDGLTPEERTAHVERLFAGTN